MARLYLQEDIYMNIKEIPIGNNPPEDVNVIIEVPVDSQPVKYEMDKKSGSLFVDRFISTSMVYPGNYGFIPHTLSEDSDPIDVLVCNTRPLIPGCVINVRPIGALIMEDDGGKDEKIIAIPTPKLTQQYIGIHDYTDLTENILKKIEHFFKHYKDLEAGKWAKIEGWRDKNFARELIQQAIERAKAIQ